MLNWLAEKEMSLELRECFSGFAVGIRFRVNFRIDSWLGEIIDKILFSKKHTIFNPQKFPFTENGVNIKSLVHKDSGSRLIVQATDIILDVNFDEKTFERKYFDDYLAAFCAEVLSEVRKVVQVEDVDRFGILKKYQISSDNSRNLLRGFGIADTDGINEFNFNFQRKIPTAKGKVDQTVDDYNNVIYAVSKSAAAKKIVLTADFQSYFDPPLPEIDEKEVEKFFSQGKSFLTSRHEPWLTSKLGES